MPGGDAPCGFGRGAAAAESRCRRREGKCAFMVLTVNLPQVLRLCVSGESRSLGAERSGRILPLSLGVSQVL